MFRFSLAFTLVCICFSSWCFAECCQSIELGVGWRRDSLKWQLQDLETSHVSAVVDSTIRFKDIDLYTAHAKAKWVDSEYYIRASADYGLSDKGRAKERFIIDSPLFYSYEDIGIKTNNKIKRRSEVYDFDGAVGYPFTFCHCRLYIVPLIGGSFHRQHIRVKEDRREISSSSFPSSLFPSSVFHSSSSFEVSSSNPFGYSSSSYSDPFSRGSDANIASALGLSIDKRTENYRFTWYGPFLGVDAAYALDTCWTLYGEFEGHFLNNCHRKRKSWTGVYFVDDYHHKGWAYGYNAKIGTTYSLSTCWYFTFDVDFKWWKAHSHHDNLKWKTVGINAGMGYEF